MAEKKAGLTISKAKGYGAEHKIKLGNFGIDKERTGKFNKGGKVAVTKEELETIGKHRWLEVHNG
jgi:hypothetical protein